MAKVSNYKPLDKNLSVDIYLDDKCIFYAEFAGKRYEASSITAIKKMLKDVLSQWSPTLEWIRILEITNNRYSSIYTDDYYIARSVGGAWMRTSSNYADEDRVQHMHTFSGIPISEDPPYVSTDQFSAYLLYDGAIEKKIKRFEDVSSSFRAAAKADIVASSNKIQLLDELIGILSSKYPAPLEETEDDTDL